MIFSLSKGFIFFGLPKSGSTSLHFLLSGYGELVFTRIENGKHETCQNLINSGHAFFEKHPYQEYLKFGVIREPTSLVRSWYRVWSNPMLENPKHPAHNRWLNGKSIDEFVDILEAEQLFEGPDSFYRMDDGSLGVDYLIRLDRMKDDVLSLEAILPIDIADKIETTHFNPSYKGPTKSSGSELDAATKSRIESVFARDMELYESVDRLNKEFLESGWRAPPTNNALATFKQLYPELYSMSENDKRYNAIKRMVPEPLLSWIQVMKKNLSEI
ncbi:MAG: hypothetical protein ACR2QG_09355 [Gammaproteobacteria bacterium]